MGLRFTKTALRRAWYSQVVTKLLTLLFVLFIFLTIYSLDQKRQLAETVRVVQAQDVLVRAQCSFAQSDPQGCRELLDRLLVEADQEQRAMLCRSATPSIAPPED